MPSRIAIGTAEHAPEQDQDDRREDARGHRLRPRRAAARASRRRTSASGAAGRRAVEAPVEVDDQPVGQHGRRDRLHVVGRHEVASPRGRPPPGRRGTGRPSPAGCRPAPRRDASASRARARRAYASTSSATRTVRTRSRTSSSRSRAITGSIVSSGSAVSWWRRAIRRSPSAVGVADLGAEQEPVQLRLRQRERALELDRVLGREHEERVRQAVRRPLDRTPGAPASPRAAPLCVRGVARLISSTSRRFVNTGPSTKRSPVALEQARRR